MTCESCGRPADDRFCDECRARILGQAAAIQGMKGGRVSSKAKTEAARINAALGGSANTKKQKSARLANMAKARAARVPTLEQIRERAIEKLLAIPEPGRRGSGAVQIAMRAGAKKAFTRSARRLGYNAEQIDEQWINLDQVAELRKGGWIDEK